MCMISLVSLEIKDAVCTFLEDLRTYMQYNIHYYIFRGV